jgi:glycosyltransferase involved in cell wall biosynthesis
MYLPQIAIILNFQRHKADNSCSAAEFSELGNVSLPFVSVILPVYNEETLIVPKMENLLQSKYPKDRMQIIVVDGKSNDKTLQLARRYEKGDEVIIVQQEKREGVTEAVKKGVLLSKGEIIIMTDAEALFDPDAIRLVVQDLQDPEIGAVSGCQVLSNPASNFFTRMEQTYGRLYEKMRLAESCLCSTSHFKGELVGVRRSLYPLNLRPFKGLLDHGIAYRAICDEKIIFHDIATDNLGDRNLQKMQRGILVEEDLLQNKDMLFNPHFGLFGTVIMPANFLLHFAFPIVFIALLILSPFVLITLLSQYFLATVVLLAAGTAAVLFTRKNRVFFFLFFHSQIVLFIGMLHVIAGGHKFIKQVKGTRKIGAQQYTAK